VSVGSEFTFSTQLQVAATREPSTLSRDLEAISLTGLRVLIVDDNRTNRLVLREMLKCKGCRMAEVDRGPLALEALRAAANTPEAFQLALVDFCMPEMDGEELARLIKADPLIAHIPLLLLTSHPQPSDSSVMADVGFAGYLLKPIKRTHLYRAMDAIHSVMQQTPKLAKRQLITEDTLEVASPRISVLVVEDNRVNQKVTMKMLERLGCQCDLAENGAEAIVAAKNQHYDLILMDCQMPVLNGYDATRGIREHEGEARHTPIVALTAAVLDDERQRCVDAGMDQILTKPLDRLQLTRLVETYSK